MYGSSAACGGYSALYPAHQQDESRGHQHANTLPLSQGVQRALQPREDHTQNVRTLLQLPPAPRVKVGGRGGGVMLS